MADWTHLDESGKPGMVDVSGKEITARRAVAEARVKVGPVVAAALAEGDLMTKKGAVLQTAIIAGTQAVKKTSELIPFCHPLPLDGCRIDAQLVGDRVVIACECTTTARTGVEMEALTGASVAALTIYDMCKALDKGMVIESTRLLSKTGGKSGDWEVEA
ncbi:cyclic pyranopterin monophosphate synthase MoaC [Sulfuriroseicoccus oceanibius]|uniref:Cyclic pyranopterin monophosphate synthase n=1 Tax=Sulfuriroseicoccus oceanibius TaxID=2707525 RepID=A0A6B3LEP9_9BACT|nr:cyclic pyranopterin monophosphate synthase MoaC [Sulfuriroseicoccus oceanibius]QQL46430.1 cyclic pyranopterin monophosphate synthase MoaC [Sulfuriroseicoccus oceanibius]